MGPLTEALDAAMSTKTTAEWLKILTGFLPVGPIYDVAQAFANPFMETVDMVAATPHPAKPEFKLLANPLKIDGKRLSQKVCSPLGADNEAILGLFSGRPPSEDHPMKLAGLRVVDLSSFLPGPYLTMTLADHGAEVIKIEAPGEGDPGRHIGLSDGPSTVFFRNFNRGKKSVVLDLKSAEGRELLLALCETADVLVETYRPGVADRLGHRSGRRAGEKPAHRLLLDQRLRPERALSRPARARSGAGGDERRARPHAGHRRSSPPCRQFR